MQTSFKRSNKLVKASTHPSDFCPRESQFPGYKADLVHMGNTFYVSPFCHIRKNSTEDKMAVEKLGEPSTRSRLASPQLLRRAVRRHILGD
jgi:hypothetical protein